MYEIMGYDIEDDGNGNFVGMSMYDTLNGDIKTFNKRRAFKKELKRAKYREKCFLAHFAEYDIGGIWGQKLEVFKVYRKVKSSFKYAVLPTSGGKQIYFFDLFNHYDKTLAEIGELIGEKKTTDPGIHEPWKVRREYCIQDSIIVGKAGKLAQDEYNRLGTSFRATVGSSAMELYQRHYQSIAYPAVPPGVLWTLKRGYYGGRTDCYKLGSYITKKGYSDAVMQLMDCTDKEEYEFLNKMLDESKIVDVDAFRMLDINSMYGDNMLIDFPHPESLLVRTNPAARCLDFEGVTHARVEVPKNVCYPILPVRGEKLLFPTGNFDGWWPNNLLRYAEQNKLCKIQKLYKTFSFTKSGPYLKDYAIGVYAEREKAKKGLKAEQAKEKPDLQKVALWKFRIKSDKNLLVNLYGKFGQVESATDFVDGGFKKRNDRPPVFSNVIWSAMITSTGYEKIQPTIDEHVYYSDTDSILTSKKFNKSFLGDGLGEWEEQGSYDMINIKGPKFYLTKDGKNITFKAKGFPKKFIHDNQEFFPAREAHLKEAGTKIVFKKPIRMGESFKRKADPETGKKLKVNQWVWTHRTVRAVYDKREVLEDGSTRPLHIERG